MQTQVVYEMLLFYGIRIAGAILALIVGLNIIGRIASILERKMQSSKVDPSLYGFLGSIARVGLQALLIISLASLLGMEMTSFVAVIAAAGFAAGLALQGTLANFAGGVLILILKPFRVGDFIEAAGTAGTVHEIQVFYTSLNTPDNRRIIVPNANLSNAVTVNHSVNPTRRVELKFGVGYEDDLDVVKETLMGMISDHELVMEDPAPQVMLTEYGDSAITFTVRAWCKREDYWTIYFQMMDQAKRVFDEKGISFPYPQLDVHTIDD
ncbi:MAG: mechanosensitive ion channel family protein [Bacillota bacterium]